MVGGFYMKPGMKREMVKEHLEKMKISDVVVGDFNARHVKWREISGDMEISSYGRWVENWREKEGYKVDLTKTKSFRNISTMDLCFSRRTQLKNRMSDRAGLDHTGQITKIKVFEYDNMIKPTVNWKKVNLEDCGKGLEELEGLDGEETWKRGVKLVENLKKKGVERRRCKWWTKELEGMVKDMKMLRRGGDKEGWRLARRVIRNKLI
ncbi:hypothetical protein HOY82DRAFT_601978 [Tuber indicum]|nr:hypothetical protein HOY82DRAFT_601978 [Tuber indicum]